MKKKLILIFALMSLIIFCSCVQKNAAQQGQRAAQQYSPETDFNAEPIDGGRGVRITEYIGTNWNVNIPQRIQNIPVTEIGEIAFYEKTIISVTIPNSVTIIGDWAFADCSSLTSITIPNSVTSIGYGAFRNCSGLTSINVATANPNYSSDNGVLYNKNKTSLIQAPGALSGSFTIPNSVTSIDNWAFSYCSDLTGALTIPASVTSIGDGAFIDCKRFESLIFATNSQLQNIGDQAFNNCSGLTSSLAIPAGVTSIGKRAFAECRSLTSIIIPNSVTSIEYNAFDNCTGLTSVTIDINITSVWFQSITSLKSVTFGNNVTVIGAYAFAYCRGLTSITIPNSVTSIGYSAFADCTSLTSVTFAGIITATNFSSVYYNQYPFPGDLRAKYLAGGIGTYTRPSGSNTWTKN